LAALQDELRRFVQQEHETQRVRLEKLWAMPLEQKVE
jgi:hypothetical protein